MSLLSAPPKGPACSYHCPGALDIGIWILGSQTLQHLVFTSRVA